MKLTHISWHNVVHQWADQSKLHWASVTKLKDDLFVSSSSLLRITWSCKLEEPQQWRTDTNRRRQPQATSLFLCSQFLASHQLETLQGCMEESKLEFCQLYKNKNPRTMCSLDSLEWLTQCGAGKKTARHFMSDTFLQSSKESWCIIRGP